MTRPASQTTIEEITASVRRALAQAMECPPDEVDLDRRMTELPGMDSLRLVECVMSAEEQWRITLGEDALYDVRTGRDFCALVLATLHENG
jgi:acyl carrier protein